MFEEKIAELLSSIKEIKEAGLSKQEILGKIEKPPQSELGDLAFPCFSLAGKLKKSPILIAEDIAKKIKLAKLPREIESVKAIGGYVNFFINKSMIFESITKEILAKRDLFGSNNIGTGKRVMIEFSSPNTNKPLHLGHLRNESIGIALSNILKSSGFNVIRANLLSDRGIHIAKTMVGYNLSKNKNPKGKSDHFIGDLYVLFNKELEKNPHIDEKAFEMLKKWEGKDKETLALWKKLDNWVVKGIEETEKTFGTKFDVVFRESEFYDRADKIIKEGLKKKIFVRGGDGAITAKLEPELPDKVVLRQDGTSIYITNDLALTPYKFSHYKLDKSIWITGSEQITYFKQLFRIFKLIGKSFADKCKHIAHGMVLLESGKMKSREGKVIDADDFIQEIKEIVRKELKKRYKLEKKEEDKRALAIALAAIKYYFLHVEPVKDILFIPEKAIAFEGDTGPYLQYTYARCCNIIKKAKKASENKKESKKAKEFSDYENLLIKKLAEFPEAVEQSSKELKTDILAIYAYNLAQLFNDFYEKCRVIGSENESARLKLVKATKQVLANALTLLGIEVLEQM